jgi:hypothetical protein
VTSNVRSTGHGAFFVRNICKSHHTQSGRVSRTIRVWGRLQQSSCVKWSHLLDIEP